MLCTDANQKKWMRIHSTALHHAILQIYNAMTNNHSPRARKTSKWLCIRGCESVTWQIDRTLRICKLRFIRLVFPKAPNSIQASPCFPSRYQPSEWADFEVLQGYGSLISNPLILVGCAPPGPKLDGFPTQNISKIFGIWGFAGGHFIESQPYLDIVWCFLISTPNWLQKNTAKFASLHHFFPVFSSQGTRRCSARHQRVFFDNHNHIIPWTLTITPTPQ